MAGSRGTPMAFKANFLATSCSSFHTHQQLTEERSSALVPSCLRTLSWGTDALAFASSVPVATRVAIETLVESSLCNRSKCTSNRSLSSSPVTASASRRVTTPRSTRLENMAKWQRDETLFFERNHALVQDDSTVQVVYAYPSEYSVGICSLGYQIVWAMLNNLPKVRVTRFFADAMEPSPFRPHLLGFSLSWELDYHGLFDAFEFLDIPRRARDRGPSDPLVFGGGPVLTANPEPFADFFDIILLGDGEDTIPAFVEQFRRFKEAPRSETIRQLASIKGVYVPALYEVTYSSSTGPILSITPIDVVDASDDNNGAIPRVVQKASFKGSSLATSTVVTPRCAWENIFMVEAVRSCPERCAFCLASYATLPFRVSPVHESLIPAIDRAMLATNRIGILGPSVTQHPQFSELLETLRLPKYDGMRLSLSSIRTNTVTTELAQTLVSRGSKSVTVAVESGSERLRKIINKKLSNDEIAAAVERAEAGGLSGLKLYGMVGLPGETDEDLDATISMLRDLRKTAPKLKLTFGCSTFVPKAHTPFQWFGTQASAEKKLKRLKKELSRLGVEFRPESYKWSVIQAIISRGDRRVSHVLELAYEYGDSLGSYKRAFKQLSGTIPPLQYYANADWQIDQPLPWAHLRTALSPTQISEALSTAQGHFRDDEESKARLLVY